MEKSNYKNKNQSDLINFSSESYYDSQEYNKPVFKNDVNNLENNSTDNKNYQLNMGNNSSKDNKNYKNFVNHKE